MQGIKIIAQNKKARHEFNLFDEFEAGLSLQGTEVKSLRAGKVNLGDGWVDITLENEAILREVHISPYSHGNIQNHAEKRPRRLLLHKKEIYKIAHAIDAKGFTVVPVKIYFRKSRIKIGIALAKGKKLHDKRDSAKEKSANKDIERAIKSRQRS